MLEKGSFFFHSKLRKVCFVFRDLKTFIFKKKGWVFVLNLSSFGVKFNVKQCKILVYVYFLGEILNLFGVFLKPMFTHVYTHICFSAPWDACVHAYVLVAPISGNTYCLRSDILTDKASSMSASAVSNSNLWPFSSRPIISLWSEMQTDIKWSDILRSACDSAFDRTDKANFTKC